MIATMNKAWQAQAAGHLAQALDLFRANDTTGYPEDEAQAMLRSLCYLGDPDPLGLDPLGDLPPVGSDVADDPVVRCVQALDAMGVPATAGRATSMAALKDHPERFSQKAIQTAVQWRKGRTEVPAQQ